MLASQTGAQINMIFNPRNNEKETFHTKNMIVESNEPGEVQNQESQKIQSYLLKGLNLPIVDF